MRPLARPLVLVALALLAACGGKDAPQDSGNPLATGWNPVSGMLCADGSATGIGVQLGTANRVLVWLSPGGACWVGGPCDASPGPFGAAEYAFASAFSASTIFNRSLQGNPFADWTYVLVPYCTGDVHAGGDVTRTYASATWRHHGYANVDAALARVAAAFPAPEKLVVAGSSAGGFGSLLALHLAHAKWPAVARIYLVDDSGQTLVGNDLPQAVRDAWWSSWNLDATITPLCGACKSDLSQFWDVLHTAHGADRLALLTTTQDSTMSGYFGLSQQQFQAGVTNLQAKLAGIPNAASFVSAGSGHAMLAAYPATFFAGTTNLLPWLAQEVSDSTSWSSVGP